MHNYSLWLHIFADRRFFMPYMLGMKRKVAIAGARGYSGLELTRILLQHPEVEVSGLFATAAFDPADSWPELKSGELQGQSISHLLETVGQYPIDHDCVFLALPHETSAEIAPKLLARGCNVIDLSGAYRLQDGTADENAAAYEKWYKMKHPALNLLKQAQYGLLPFYKAKPSSKPQLISNPGCYATALNLALIPLLQSKLIDPSFVAIDAKSGTTGAGKKAEERLLFSEVNDNCLPYRVGMHQHEPEIQMALKRWGGSTIDMSFTPHLIPVRRGIIATIYGKVPAGTTTENIRSAFQNAFEGYPLVRFGDIADPGQERELKLSRVVGSPRTHIVWKLDGTRVTVFSLIDNLLKGAASQAVENMNSIFGWDVSTGLTQKEGLL
jgi:N-acetyl-gamma-glutamyl-phosphate reductase